MVTVTRTFTRRGRRGIRVEGPEGGGQGRHGDDGLRDRRHGSELQVEALLYALRGRAGRTATRHHQRVPRRLPSIDRNRPEGRNRPVLPRRQFPWRLWPRACGRYRERKGNSRAQRWVSTEKLWKWIDERGKDFGIGRPYLNRDPPHVAPIDGQEYVSRRGGAKTQEAEATPKKVSRVAARDDRGKAKPAKTARAKAVQAKAAKNRAGQNRTGQDRQNRKIAKGRTM